MDMMVEEAKYRSCFNCKWGRFQNIHFGCYYNYEWKQWIPQKIAKLFPYCETPMGKHLKQSYGCKWEKAE
jgi:hypothetical protein